MAYGSEKGGARAIVIPGYPFESRYLDIDGVRMHYLDEGSGAAVVLLHGNPTWSFYYRDLIAGLRNRFRVIVPDHVGCGLSDKPQRYPYTLATHIENFSRLMEHLHLEGITLGVHDWGGPIGLGWATRNAHRLERLLVFNTAAFLGGRMPLRIRICAWPVLGDVLVRGLNAFCQAATFMACKNRARMTPQVRFGYLAPYNSWANRVGILRFVQDIPFSPRVPSHAVLAEIEAKLPLLRDKPMTIFWGMKDFCFTCAYVDQWMQHFPEARIHRLEAAGHYVVEDASERILTVLRAELEGRPERPGTESTGLENAGRFAARS